MAICITMLIPMTMSTIMVTAMTMFSSIINKTSTTPTKTITGAKPQYSLSGTCWRRTPRSRRATGHGSPAERSSTLNLVSGPGAGKTTLLERTVRELQPIQPFFVIEGDQATTNDSLRIKAAGAPVVQINTGSGCHLDADMVARGVAELKPSFGSILMIENVGNLVCPALFDLGESAKVAILSVTEGDDKPIKYPHMFQAASLLLINKIDLLPYVDFGLDRCQAYARQVNPAIEIMMLSAKTGEGLVTWFEWISAASCRERAGTFPQLLEALP